MFRSPIRLALPLLLPMALLAGTALAAPSPMMNGQTDDPLELAQATTPATPPAATPAKPDRPAFNPKGFCLEDVARRASNRAYLKVRLDLKPEQMTAWSAFAKVADDADAKDVARCNALPTELKDRPTYLERLTVEEEVLKARLSRLESVKPSLQALYATLSTEQKEILDRPRPPGPMAGMAHGMGSGMGMGGPGMMMHRHGPR
ncbi:MAG: Spy/CpxP family protein refolding chaperone [Reyranellaceae bacterium]